MTIDKIVSRDELRNGVCCLRRTISPGLRQRFAPLFGSGPSCLGLADLANCCGAEVKAEKDLRGGLGSSSSTCIATDELLLD